MTPDEACTDAIYQELRKLAGSRMAGERGPRTLQPTALVHEAWIRLSESGVDFQDRNHFLAMAAVAMRRILVERARRLRRQKHGGEFVRVTLADDAAGNASETVDIIALDAALEKLARVDPPMAVAASMRYILQYTIDETAAALAVSPAKLKKDLAFARAWLLRQLGEPHRP